MNKQTSEIIMNAMLGADEAFPQMISVKKAERIYGEMLDSRRNYAVADGRLYCLQTETKYCECCGSGKVVEEYVLYSESIPGCNRQAVFDVLKSNADKQYSKTEIEQITGLTKNSVVHSVKRLLEANKIIMHRQGFKPNSKQLFSFNEEPDIEFIAPSDRAKGLWLCSST